MAEMPMMAASAYSSTSQSIHDLMALNNLNQQMTGQAHGTFGGSRQPSFSAGSFLPPDQAIANASRRVHEEPVAMADVRRIVQVFIADTDPDVPVGNCLLYQGEQKLTEATDQELFFEVDIRKLLDEHNAKRTKMVRKAVKDRVEHLEAARIRDLKMTVVVVATF